MFRCHLEIKVSDNMLNLRPSTAFYLSIGTTSICVIQLTLELCQYFYADFFQFTPTVQTPVIQGSIIHHCDEVVVQLSADQICRGGLDIQ